MNYKVILDTDIADDIDDAFALGLLTSLKNVELLGVTTVYKNVKQRSKVAKYELDKLGFPNVPVHSGINKPSCKDIKPFDFEKTCDLDGNLNISHYDESLMGGYEPDEGDATSFIIEMVRKYPNEITLVPIGPLTNVYDFYNRDKEAFYLLKNILMMGTDPVTTHPEWNIFVDPKAAQKVIYSGLPIKTIGFRETIQTVYNQADLDKLHSMKHPGNVAIVKMMDKWILDHNGRMPIMHDALTIAELDNSFCKFNKYDILIDDEGKSYYTLNPSSNIEASYETDARGFLDYLINKMLERE